LRVVYGRAARRSFQLTTAAGQHTKVNLVWIPALSLIPPNAAAVPEPQAWVDTPAPPAWAAAVEPPAWAAAVVYPAWAVALEPLACPFKFSFEIENT
jgi:hypothetical protein